MQGGQAQDETLKDWGRIFAEGQLQLHAKRFLIAFLALELRDPPTADCKKLREMAEGWKSASPAIVVMPPLERVWKKEVEHWASAEASSELGLSDLDLQFLVEINDVFAKDDRVYMNTVISALREPLERVFQGVVARQ